MSSTSKVGGGFFAPELCWEEKGPVSPHPHLLHSPDFHGPADSSAACCFLGELHLKACFQYERMERSQLFLLYLLVYEHNVCSHVCKIAPDRSELQV